MAPAGCRRPVRRSRSPRAGGLCGRSRPASSGMRTSRSEPPETRPTQHASALAEFSRSTELAARSADMQEVSTFRLYLLRATYLLIVVGLGVEIWPGILHPPEHLEHMRG